MSTRINLHTQVQKVLRRAHGGTGNVQAWSRGRIVVGVNREGSDLPLGTLVRYRMAHSGDRVEPTDTAAEVDVLGVVVGYFDSTGADSELLIEADAPTAFDVAVLIEGSYRVAVTATVAVADFAFASATAGAVDGDSTFATGAFGQFTTSGDTTATVYLWGGAARASGGGGGGSIEVTEVDAAPDVTPVTIIRVSNGTLTDDTGGQVTITIPTPGTPAVTYGVAAAGASGIYIETDAVLPNPVAGVAGGLVVTIITPGTGVYTDVEMPFAGAFTGWTVLNDAAGSITYDVWVDAYANFPPTVTDTHTAADKPKTTGAAAAQGACTGWTTAFAAGDIVRVNVDSTSGLTRSVLVLKYTRT